MSRVVQYDRMDRNAGTAGAADFDQMEEGKNVNEIRCFVHYLHWLNVRKQRCFFKTYSAGSEDVGEVPIRGIRATKKFRARTKYKDRR